MSAEALEPLTPADAVEWYLEHRRESFRMATWRKNESALGVFLEWTDEVDIENINQIGGRELMAFKTWWKDRSEITAISLNGNLSILRRFLRFCEQIDAVAEGVADRTPLPNVPPEDEVNYQVPTDEEVGAFRDYFRRFEYASRRQTELELVCEVGVRLGAVRAIDLGDIDDDKRRMSLRHRPEGPEVYGTPLKNGTDSERYLNLSERLTQTIADYIDNNRINELDTFGREPLFTTKSGRPATSTIRRDFYKMTRPCIYGQGCPHDREITECDARTNSNADDCPSRYSTHPLRKWSIMHQLDAGISKEYLSDRVDVSIPVLERHYDQRSEERKSRRRREELADNLSSYSVN